MSSGKVLIKEIPEMLDDALPGAAVSERAADRAAPALREEAARSVTTPGKATGKAEKAQAKGKKA